MKKLFQSLLLLFFISLLAACENGTKFLEASKKHEPLSKLEELENMYKNPKKYKGREVEFYARVFVEPQQSENSTYFQVFMNNDSDRNVIVFSDKLDVDLEGDDSVFIHGVVRDVYESENIFGGGTVTAPLIEAKNVEKVSYSEAFAPTKKTIVVNQTQEQHGYIVTLEKVELADEETRLYVTVKNESKNEILFYDSDSKLIVNNKQIEAVNNYKANYPEVPFELLPGVESSGIVAFPKIEETSATVKWHVEGYSHNYDIEIQPFVFEFKIP